MPALTVAGDVGNNELGVGLEYGLVGQAPFGIGAGLGTLHPDIARLDQLEKQVFPFGLAEVQRDIPLVAPFLNPGGCHLPLTVFRGQLHPQMTPGRVALPGAFDLDDLSAHFRSQGRGKRLGNQGSARYNPHALQRAELFG